MKLKTKFEDEDFDLGEVVDATINTTSLVDTYIKLKAKAKRGGEHTFYFESLKDLNDLFEDVPEESKGYWFIDCAAPYPVDFCEFNEDTEDDKEIGNYFETKEEAEKAVEKLKAWKRLKDKGFINEQVFSMNLNWCNPDDDDWKAFKLLFGGEE